MPLKLLSFFIILIAVTIFIGFNIENRCDVSFVFYTFLDVPVFVSLLFAYVAGALTIFPFFLGYRKKRPEKLPKPVKLPKQPKPPKNGKRQGGDNIHDYNIN